MASITTETKVRKQACDPCKARKVRCNGENRCQQCSHLGLSCIYSARRGRSAKLDRGRHVRAWKIQKPVDYVQVALAEPEDVALALPPLLFEDFIQDYEQYVYPFHPIISPAEASDAIREMDISTEARAFVYALAAITINLTRSDHVYEHVEPWVDSALKLQEPVLNTEQITARKIITVQWMHVCLMGMQKLDLAFYYLRQATSMVQLLRVDKDELPIQERARMQRLYGLIFVHERFVAISFQWAVVLPLLDQLLVIDLSIPARVEHGFRQIIKLFSHVDADLLAKWNPRTAGSQVITRGWIESKHNAIENESINAYGGGERSLSDDQLADLIITKHWLHMLLWQIAVSQCLLTSSAEEESMSLLLPIRISSQLRGTLTDMPKEMFMIHGSCMHQKLFEITDTIGDVLTTVPAASAEDHDGRMLDFLFLHDFLSSLPNWDAKQRTALENKLSVLRQKFPSDPCNI